MHFNFPSFLLGFALAAAAVVALFAYVLISEARREDD